MVEMPIEIKVYKLFISTQCFYFPSRKVLMYDKKFEIRENTITLSLYYLCIRSCNLKVSPAGEVPLKKVNGSISCMSRSTILLEPSVIYLVVVELVYKWNQNFILIALSNQPTIKENRPITLCRDSAAQTPTF